MTLALSDSMSDPSPATLVSEGLVAGERCFSFALDALTTLDARRLAALISALRVARERGGDVELSVSRHDLLRTLAVTGLDRVFSIVPAATADRIADAPVKRRAPVRTVAATACGRM